MTAPAVEKPAANAKQGQPPLRALPFRAGVQPSEFQTYDETRALNAGTQTLPTYTVEPTGFLTDLYLLVEGTTAGNAAAVTFAADAPFNVLDLIEFKDAGPVGSLIGGAQFNGYDLMIANKYGGYSHNDDPRAGVQYSATAGAGATGGSFSFILRIPLELVKRDGVGSLVNKSSSTTYKVYLRLATSATPYGVAPTNAASVRVRIIPESYWDPDENDRLLNRALTQVPPLSGTTQFWTKGEYGVNAGAISPMISTGLGNLIRNIVFVLRDTNGSRAQGDTDWPDPFTLKFEAQDLVNRLKTYWQYRIGRDYGYTGAAEAAGGRDNGVYPLPFNHDFGLKPGAETRRAYLRTSPDSRLQIQGTVAGAGVHTFYVLVNHVAPSGDPATLIV